MRESVVVEIVGSELRKLRVGKYLTQVEMAAKMGAGGSYSRLQHIEGAEVARVRPGTLRKLAESFGMGPDELLAVIGKTVPENVKGIMSPAWPGEIPLLQLSLAAGAWTDISELSEPGELDAAVFMVHLAGDSMLPIYPEGVVVLFRRLCLDRESPVPTRDYYVQRSDGLATFKMLEKAGETEYVLRALNRRKYPQPLTVEKSLVVNMAAAVGKVELI